MSDYDAYIGLDVHKDSISVAFAEAGRLGEVRLIGTIANEPDAISKLVRKLGDRHGLLEFAYEAGPCGYNVFQGLNLLTFNHGSPTRVMGLKEPDGYCFLFRLEDGCQFFVFLSDRDAALTAPERPFEIIAGKSKKETEQALVDFRARVRK